MVEHLHGKEGVSSSSLERGSSFSGIITIMAKQPKRLYRDPKNAMIGGVCAGIAEYLNADPTIIRLLAVLLAFAGGGGIVAYLVGWIVIPAKPAGSTKKARA